MEKCGFRRGVSTPCVFYRADKNLRVVVHGDDFTSCGPQSAIEWFKAKISERYESKHDILGPGATHQKSIRVLNRVLTWTPDGIQYEADQRHAELIVQQQNLGGAKAVSTPGEEVKPHEKEDNAEVLNQKDAHEYRGLAARANYLAMDRPDIQYAVKEICRSMAVPTVGAKKNMKSLGRYLVGRPRVVPKYRWQGKEQ